MSGKLKCPRCDAPFWHFTAVNTRKFECGSDSQIASMGCKYASQLRHHIKRLEEAGDALKASGYFGGFGDAVNKWVKVKEDKP